jgi:formylglycine-generating enzyme required for sulfatase activity
MTATILLVEGDQTRSVPLADLPLSIGGAGADIELDGAESGASLLLGRDGDSVFVQPSDDGASLRCNGIPLAASRWLEAGDVLHLGTHVIRIAGEDDVLRLTITAAPRDRPTEPPVGPAHDPPVASAGEPISVTPIRFERTGGPDAGGRVGRRLRPVHLLLAVVATCVIASCWFVMTARAVIIQIEPRPDAISIEGGVARPQIAGRYLLRPGGYTVTAERTDHRTLVRPITVTDQASQVFRFSMELLPGRLTVATGALSGAVVELDSRVIGTTPLTDYEVEVGDHSLVVRADRHQVHTQQIRIEAPGERRRIDLQLIPAWASIGFRSSPSGAEVVVDGRGIGLTPLDAELGAGPHRVTVRKPGFKPSSRRFTVVANTPEDLPVFELEPADARVRVESSPTGATVTVGQQFAGQTPLEVTVPPDREHVIRLAKAGYEPVTERVLLPPEGSRRLEITLPPRFGEVRVESTPTGADVVVDGETVGTTAQTFRLTALPHTIEVRKSGYATFTASVVPEPDMLETIHAVLQAESSGPSPTAELIATSQGASLKLVEPARVDMGASRREPGRRANETLRTVAVTRVFYLGIHEVTNEQYREFASAHDSGRAGGTSLGTDAQPVVRVTWEDAVRYCNWLSVREGLQPVYAEEDGQWVAQTPFPSGYRLPTEAEWALAARMAGTNRPRKYVWGDGLPIPRNAGNFADRSARELLGQTLPDYDDGHAVASPVGSFEANPLGLFDLGGNVAEWVNDGYTIYPPATGAVERDPLGPARAEYHVIRGASWMDGTLTRIRLSYRDYGDEALPNVGFRLARSAD